jgi:hypothetical protein
LEDTGRRRAAAHTCAALDLVLVTPLALMWLGESGGRRAHALDLVLVTHLELLLGVEEPGGRRDPAPDLVLQVIATISSVHSGVLRLAFMGLEEPGGRRAHALDLVLWLSFVEEKIEERPREHSLQADLSSCQVRYPYYKMRTTLLQFNL